MKMFKFGSGRDRTIREATFTHRVTAGCIFQVSAATSLAKAKSLACKKLTEVLSKAQFRVDFVCPFCPCKATVMASCQIVTSSLLFRMIRGGIVHFLTQEDNTKETRSCPIVLRRHHDYVKPSQYRLVAVVL